MLAGLPSRGEIVAEKYRIERLLGSGGMGDVFKAQHVNIIQTVAIKFLHPSISNQPEWEKRFHREAFTASCL
jgi:serine/threonine protein kinase